MEFHSFDLLPVDCVRDTPGQSGLTAAEVCDDEAVVLSEDVRHDGVEGVQRPHGGLVLVPLVVRTEESRVGLEELHTRVT